MTTSIHSTTAPTPTPPTQLGPDLDSPALKSGLATWSLFASEWAQAPTSAPPSPGDLAARLDEAALLMERIQHDQLPHDTSPAVRQRAHEVAAGMSPLLEAAHFVAAVLEPMAHLKREPLTEAGELWAAGLQGARVLVLMGGKPPRRLLRSAEAPCPLGPELGDLLSDLSQVLAKGWRLIRVAQPFQPDPRLQLSWTRLERMAALGAALKVTPAEHHRGTLGLFWRTQVAATYHSVGRALEVLEQAWAQEPPEHGDARPPLPPGAELLMGGPAPERPMLSFDGLMS